MLLIKLANPKIKLMVVRTIQGITSTGFAWSKVEIDHPKVLSLEIALHFTAVSTYHYSIFIVLACPCTSFAHTCFVWDGTVGDESNNCNHVGDMF